MKKYISDLRIIIFFCRKNTFHQFIFVCTLLFRFGIPDVVYEDKHNYLFIRSADLDFDNLVTSRSCDKTSNGKCLSSSFQFVVL